MKKDSENIPRVGTGIMIKRGGKVLLGNRKNTHGDGEWSFPGGKLEYWESIRNCALREIKEECGVKVKNLVFQNVLNVKKYDRHFVAVGFLAEWKSGEPKVLEPDKFYEWKWFDLKKLPKNLFYATKLMIKGYKNKQVYFDA
jgi:8-oxo-dGTP diphosphatase